MIYNTHNLVIQFSGKHDLNMNSNTDRLRYRGYKVYGIDNNQDNRFGF